MPAGPGERTGGAWAPERDPLTNAVIDLILERGYEGLSVETLLERAGIPRGAFESRYSGIEDCVLQTMDEGIERFREVVFAAYGGQGTWREGMRAAAYAAARWVRDHPRYIVFSTMMMNSASEMARVHRDRALQMFVELVDAGRAELEDPSAVSPQTAMTVIGSIYELLQRELSKGHSTARAEDFVPELMYLAVRPYLGHAEALKELSIPPPGCEGDEAGP